ncbi:hypothetical protein [Bradyrhizobium sp. AZCC 2230]|uniref:hypothetical protein n=1 Tax=Bradyrhizobium sp. AZCC 2230 TaxID=3117021 RepID=UPI002FF287D3
MTKDFLAIVNQMAALVDDRILAQFTKTSFLVGGYHFDSGRLYQRIVRYNETTGQYEREEFGGIKSAGKGFSLGFIGDERAAYFKILGKLIHEQQTELNFQPLQALSLLLKSQDRNSAVGGSPQVVKVYRHRNYLPYAIRATAADDKVTLFGRPLLSYERTFYPVIALDRFGQTDFVHYPDMPRTRTLQPPPKIGDPPKRAGRRNGRAEGRSQGLR